MALESNHFFFKYTLRDKTEQNENEFYLQNEYDADINIISRSIFQRWKIGFQ